MKMRKPDTKPFEIEHKMAKARHQNAEVSPAALGVYPAELACFCACRASLACGAKDYDKQCLSETRKRWMHRKKERDREREKGTLCP